MIRRAAPSFALATLLALSACAPCAKPSAVQGAPPATGGPRETHRASDARVAPVKSLEALQRDFVDLRFGMFIHFGILTYTGSWGQGNLDIELFNPTRLDPGQWADAAAAAHMKYGVLTTRHHDGFALWPSRASEYNVGHIPWRQGQGDVVAEYVTAFRRRGLLPGLYYSIWDITEGVASGQLTPDKLAYVETQITELLTNYGPIPILVMDGWSWQMGHNAVAYERIRSLVKSLQPDCLLTDHTHLCDPWDVDIVSFEEPKGAWAPDGNRYPAQQGQKVNATGGNDWFWGPGVGGLMTVEDVVTRHLADLEPKWTNFLLNCPPNRDGTLDPEIVALLRDVGQAWAPDLSRPPLPAQGPQNEHPYTPVSAVATSGDASNAIDGKNDQMVITLWEPAATLPQAITLDLGQVRPGVGWLGCLPRYYNESSSLEGNVTSYRVLTSTDGNGFSEATAGTWAADGRMKVATFGPRPARFVRFEIRAAHGRPAVTELTLGGRP
ncbi:MAG: alpha-L-fucosidase [Polyangiaceae bacterium]|nr:alpha-L-fucosidase [Polyangiaceae bacterium]